jgi:hypothetical protein
MYPYLVLEMLAAERRRDLLAEAAGEQRAATMVVRKLNWWKPITATLSHLICVAGGRRRSQIVNSPVAVVNDAWQASDVRPSEM